MLGDIIKTVANVTLDICAVKSLELNNSEKPRSREERAKRQQTRKAISNVRNAAYLLKRLIG